LLGILTGVSGRWGGVGYIFRVDRI
jgi:hypothetical protein